MWCWSRHALVAALLTVSVAPSAALDFWQGTVARGDWERAAGDPVALDAVRQLLDRFEEVPGVRVYVRHPGGDAGSLWGLEMRDRLVACGIPVQHLELQPGSGGLDILHLSMVDER